MPASERRDHLLDVPRPVLILTRHYGAGHRSVPHFHSKSQLLIAESGVMRVTTADGSWVIPVNRAIWIPPETPHSVHVTNRAVTRSIYVDPCLKNLGAACVMIHVTELLRALVLEFARMNPLYEGGSSEERLVGVLLDYVKPSNAAPVVVPKANDMRLRRIMDHLLVDPQDNRTLSEWASELGVCEKTLTRGFLRETNMSFRKWRQQARLLKALELLADGHSVANVAADVGYESTSAFITLFKESFGVLPGSYYSS